MSEEKRVFDLEQPRTADMPIHPAHRQAGYSYLLHRYHQDEYRPEEAGPRSGAVRIIICGEHTGTHIDALCHPADGLTLYGGVHVDRMVQTPRGFSRRGVEAILQILAPGVMLDLVASEGVGKLEFGRIVTSSDLEECARLQGVEVEPGSVLLVRTGSGRFRDGAERYLAGPGLDASASYWAAERGVLAVRGSVRGEGRARGERDPPRAPRGAPPRGHGSRLRSRWHRHDPLAHRGARDHRPPGLLLKVGA